MFLDADTKCSRGLAGWQVHTERGKPTIRGMSNHSSFRSDDLVTFQALFVGNRNAVLGVVRLSPLMELRMGSKSHDVLLAKLSLNMRLTDEEKAAVQGIPIRTDTFRAKTDIVREGDRPRRSCVIVEGTLATAKATSKGRRAITALHVPGDMPDLYSLHLNVMDCSLTALTDCRIGFIDHSELMRFFEAWPRILHGMWRGTLVEGSIYREQIVNIGHREAPIRIAHLFCELSVRNRVALNDENLSFSLPITQTELADLTGMSTVHVNRALQSLRASGMITYSAGVVTIVDWERLIKWSDFNPVYLHLPELPEGVSGTTDPQWGLAH